MGPSSILTYGLGGVAVFGILAIVLQKLASGSSIKDAIEKFKKKEKQEALASAVEDLSKEQQVIVKQLKASEAVSEESKKKIEAIVKKTAVEVQALLKVDTIQQLDDEIQKDWEDL